MNPDEITLKVREIFYTLQGEGARAGQASIFIRLAMCNKECWFCDTDWSFGRVHTLAKIAERINKYPCEWIVWTGGEPTIQLTDAVVDYFRELGYRQAIETNGTNPVPKDIDYIACSPKVTPEVLWHNFEMTGVDEYRFPVNNLEIEKQVPRTRDIPPAKYYYLSPLFLGEKKQMFAYQKETVAKCVAYIKEHPEWSLSVQQHKLWGIP